VCLKLEDERIFMCLVSTIGQIVGTKDALGQGYGMMAQRITPVPVPLVHHARVSLWMVTSPLRVARRMHRTYSDTRHEKPGHYRKILENDYCYFRFSRWTRGVLTKSKKQKNDEYVFRSIDSYITWFYRM